MADRSRDSSSELEVFLLDMGMTKYGDCILCRRGADSILIDGGHKGDIHDRGQYLSIPNQLAEIFGHSAPFPISLLVVTHCHDDHIGCLPEMIAQDIIRPEWALVADKNLGFGIAADGSDAADAPDITPAMKRLIAGLREEDQSDLPDDELSEFLADAATLIDRYSEMLETIEGEIGDRLVRYGVDDDAALRDRFEAFGMQILGPTQDHLLICAEQIHQAVNDLVDELRGIVTDGMFSDNAGGLDEVAAYRAMAGGSGSELDDAGRPGFALNDQSIVLQIKTDDENVLLSGDMQFADPNIDELIPFMTDLRNVIAAEAPFDLVKIAHHASHNAFDEDVLAEMGETPRYVISGGIKDKGHPHKSVLKLLKRAKAESDVEWARTDKNGMITATFGATGGLDIRRGRLSNTRPNVFDAPTAAPAPMIVPPMLPPLAAPAGLAVPSAGPPGERPQTASDVVRVITEIPHTSTQVTVTINVQPAAGLRPAPSEPSIDAGVPLLGGGRALPPLLFITSKDKLQQNIGEPAATAALKSIRNAQQLLIDTLPTGATQPNQVLQLVRPVLAAHPELQGVVILGGYDVVPASRLDAIDAALRTAIHQSQNDGSSGDIDDFIVWSDAIYGDKDGDGMGEVPVSRIPDGRSGDLLLRAMQAGKAKPTRRAGIRNVKRPFAKKVFKEIPFTQHTDMLVSELTAPTSAEFANGHLEDAALYLMLHGNYLNPSHFAGERATSGSFTAVNVSNLANAKLDKAVVLAGCCWGALTVRERAIDVAANAAVTPLRPEESMALSFLNGGALAFVGCTGVHYSPLGNEPSYNGGPLHAAFWRHYKSGKSPAAALFDAKSDYIGGIPHEAGADAFDRAVELKIMREFTCLGLGW